MIPIRGSLSEQDAQTQRGSTSHNCGSYGLDSCGVLLLVQLDYFVQSMRNWHAIGSLLTIS